jgi:tetratricopeptide (TPR) repeat protein
MEDLEMQTRISAFLLAVVSAWLTLSVGSLAVAQEPARPGAAPNAGEPRDEAVMLFSRAIQQKRNNQREEAVNTYKELVQKCPKSNWAGCALVSMGIELMGLGRVDEAMQAFERAIKEYPESRYGNGKLAVAHAYYSVADCLWMKGDRDQAVKAFAEAIKRFPDVRTGDNDGCFVWENFLDTIARDEEGQAREQGPEGAFNLDQAEYAYWRASRERLDMALRCYQKVLNFYPKHKLAGASLAKSARLLFVLGLYDEAIARYRRVLDEYPEAQFPNGKPVAPYAAWRMACCYVEKGDMQNAKKAFELALEKFPDAGAGGRLYGEVLMAVIEKVNAAAAKPEK